MRHHYNARRHVRPFMPLYGAKTVPHKRGGGIMPVGAEFMIDDNSPVNPEEQRTAMTDDIIGVGIGAEVPSFGAEETNGDVIEFPGAEREIAGETPSGSLEEEIEKLRAERDSYLDMARRERADFDNYRKRVERDMKQIKRESLATFLKEFFNPLDDMDRALRESEKNHSFESLVQGVRIMEENFWRSLAKIGVKKIDAMRKPFDPNLHEAMAMVPSADVPPNTVLEVYESGYKLDDFILRPARVVVSCAPAQ